MSKPKKPRALKRSILLIPLVLVILAGAGFFYVNDKLKAVGSSEDTVIYEVLKGETLNQVQAGLLEQGLIKDATVFGYYARYAKLTDFKAGLYKLNQGMDVQTILTILNDPTAAMSKDVIITIVPGDWAKTIAAKLAEKCTKVTAEQLLELWNDEAYIRSLMKDYSVLTEDIFVKGTRVLLEGYLMPETYYMNPEASADSLTRRILNQTQKVYDANKALFDAFGMSVHDSFILASVVQFEAKLEPDMKMISQVLLNRLAIQMPLQVSVSVCYALYEYKDWTECENLENQKIDSPYNTYLYKGLPLGPITNPSRETLLATLQPTPNKYYFFIADVYGDGKIYYAETYAEHLKNVEKYLK